MYTPEFRLEVGECSDLRGFWKFPSEGHCKHVTPQTIYAKSAVATNQPKVIIVC